VLQFEQMGNGGMHGAKILARHVWRGVSVGVRAKYA
jgi:hypothetical protein